MEKFKYEIRQMSWSKRRKHTEENLNIEDIKLENFKYEHNHFCSMIVTHKNEVIILNARVLYNDKQDYWVVAGIDNKGHQCSIKLKK